MPSTPMARRFDYVGMQNAEMLSAALRRKGSVDLSPRLADAADGDYDDTDTCSVVD